jgi:TRAP-type uncharacterized transport system substrate-binding protein
MFVLGGRWQLFIGSIAILCVIVLGWLVLDHFLPAPPSSVTLATAFKGASFDYYGRRYRERFARSKVQLELRETPGAVENLTLLLDPTSGVQIAFMTGGISKGKLAPGIMSLGVVYTQPYWLFYKSTERIERLSQLKGRRIAVGPKGSGTRHSAEQILGKGGVNSETATLLSFAGDEAVDALKDDKVDAVWIIGAPDATAVQSLLRNPDVRLMSFPMGEAFTRIYPDLVRLVLPQGVVDIDRVIPANDVPIIGTTTRILVRSDLHPEIVHLLLQTMMEEHSGPGIFQRSREFPNANDAEYPVAASAIEYYKYGPSFLQRHLPLWLTVYIQRAIALLVTGIAIGIPLLSFGPKLYRWYIDQYLRRLYRALRTIEDALQTELSTSQMAALGRDLLSVDRAAGIIPKRHSDQFIALKLHIDRMREKLVARKSGT